MELSHRPLRSDDARLICSFAQTAEELFFFFPKASFPLSPQVLMAEAAQRFSPTVALAGDHVVGYVNLLEVIEKRYCTIGNLAVDPASRRQGVARYLVQTMVAEAVEHHGAKFIRVACFSHNTAAYQMYHAMGFKPDDMEQRTSPQGEPVLLVNMILRRPEKLGRMGR